MKEGRGKRCGKQSFVASASVELDLDSELPQEARFLSLTGKPTRSYLVLRLVTKAKVRLTIEPSSQVRITD